MKKVLSVLTPLSWESRRNMIAYLCEQHGVVGDCNVRWEQGIPHHPLAETIFKLLEISDFTLTGDCFGWTSGGDGDNGETLMYGLSVLLELDDKIEGI